MAVGAPYGIGESTFGSANFPRTSIKNRIKFGAPAGGPFGEALFIEGHNAGVSEQPNAVVRIVQDRENLIGRQTLLRVYRANMPVLKPAQTNRGADPHLAVSVRKDGIDIERSKTFVGAEILHTSVGQTIQTPTVVASGPNRSLT